MASERLFSCFNSLPFPQYKDESGQERKATRFVWDLQLHCSPVSRHQTGAREKEKGSVSVFIFPPCRKGLHWWFWICCPFRDTARFWPGLSFLFPPFSSQLSHPGARGREEPVQSAAIRWVIKIIQVLLGLPWEGGTGRGRGLSGYTAQSAPSYQDCYILYWLLHAPWETEELLEVLISWR